MVGSWGRALGMLASLAVAAGILTPQVLLGATPTPAASPSSTVTMSAEPLLGGDFRSGAWAAVRVLVENGGPPIDGELRIATSTDGSARYGITVHLASGARQEHILYGRTGLFAGRFNVSLVSGSQTHATANVSYLARDADALGLFVVAERPQVLVGPLRDAVSLAGQGTPAIVSVRPEDLPARVEAWSSVDLLIWQDVHSGRLDVERVDALRTWIAMGGDLIVLAGSTGAASLGAFPDDMLPFHPSATGEVSVAEMQSLAGVLPAGAAPVPALGGPLARGKALAGHGDSVTAARAPFGLGTVTVIGFDPSIPWLADSPAGDALWRLIVPPRLGASASVTPSDDGYLVNAVGNLPTVQLPRADHLLLLIVAYVLAIGPINYVVLRRRDRREWGWLTIPLTIAVFAGIAFGFGLLVKGPSVIVNQLAVVRGAVGADRGLADVWVGVYSPSRTSFDVRVSGDVLISPPASSEDGPATERAMDVLLGEQSTVRDYAIGFGGLRAFHAHGAVSTPQVDAALTLANGALSGTLRNASSVELNDVALVYGGNALLVGDVPPGASRDVNLQADAGISTDNLARRLFPQVNTGDQAATRRDAARRAMVTHLSGGFRSFEGSPPSGVFSGGPVILAWAAGGRLEVELGTSAEQIGETVYVFPAPVSVTGPIVLGGALMQSTMVAVDAVEGFAEGPWLLLSRGTLTVEYRPAGFDGSFTATDFLLRLGPETSTVPTGAGEELSPLPDAEQPDQSDPLAADPRPEAGPAEAPRLQLFERHQEKWIEFEPVRFFQTYRIADPARFVDEAGAFVVRFVVRSNDYLQFALAPRLEGTVE